MPHLPFLVVGSGVAGLSAATALAERGERVLVLEQHGYAGGRTRSFVDGTTGDVIDNGQHLLMGCYAATRTYLARIGSSHLAALQPGLEIPYLRPGHAPTAFRVPALPAPFHLLAGLLRFRAIPRSERTALLRFGRALFSLTPEAERTLDGTTAEEWLARFGQGPESRRYLWDVITIGALNEHPRNVSALLLARVLRAAFSGPRTNASLLVPTVGLSELLVDPAVAFIEAHGGEVRLNAAADELLVEDGRVTGVRAGGEPIGADAVILAVPWHDVHRLAPREARLEPPSSFAASPILSIQTWFDRPVTSAPLTAVLDSTVQWIFTKPARPHHLSAVVSAAGELADLPKEQILDRTLAEMRSILPSAATATLLHALVLKEKRATFVPRPGLESLRPGTTTALEGLFLAGDWTNTGLPATIEGGVLSGERAALSARRGTAHSSPAFR